ncbi:hypothetical protein TCDM_12153 [Trypanosoma cruzi Dm28c]|uniref:Reverse transcriptase domain-containing protein n=1 Tax=Trypanosoma cruzi Dm28c TaxID=1416333 RepID=V5B2Y7_TRYCR|nr:hypothetical protein TCDM_12153 [Trypanosoma cruzi Dm28c]
MLDRLPRLGPQTKRRLHNYLRGRYVRVCTREQHSRKQLASAGAPQGSVPGPKLFLHCVDDLPHRMENIYFAFALMYTDALTLVASGADIHACAAAMPPALSRITTWAAEHSLKINVAKSEAALSHISSHTESEEDMADLLPGNGTYVFSPAQCACWTPRSIDFLILVRTLPPLQSRPRHAVTNCDRSHRLVRSITIRNPFRLDTVMLCNCIMAMQLSHASPTSTSIIWNYCTATVVKHTLALVHQRKIHLSS